MQLWKRPLGTLAIVFGLATAAAAAVRADSAAPSTPSGKRVAPLAWLVGGVWTADASKLGPGLQRIETRYTWADNDAYIRFTTHFVSEKGTLRNYDGNFFWNPDRSALAFWYTDAQSAVTEGPVAIDGDTMELTFRARDFDGKLADMKVDVVRSTSDRYVWSLAEKTGDAWKPLFSLEYVRKAS